MRFIDSDARQYLTATGTAVAAAKDLSSICSQGPRETGYWEPNRNKKQAEQPNHQARRKAVLGAQ